MSSFDAAPLPRLGQVFFDVRGSSRSMRVSWYGDTGVAVFSIWQGGRCVGTFRLPVDDLPRMVETLRRGPDGADIEPAAEPARPARPPRPADPEPATSYAPGPPLPDLPLPDLPGPDLPRHDLPRHDLPRHDPLSRPDPLGPPARPERRSASHAAPVEVDPSDPLGLGYSEDPAAGYRDGGYQNPSDPYGAYGPAEGSATDPGTASREPYSRPGQSGSGADYRSPLDYLAGESRDYPHEGAYAPAEPGYHGGADADYAAGHRDYRPGDRHDYADRSDYAGRPAYGDRDGYAERPDYGRRASADHGAPYDSWAGPESGAHSQPPGWAEDYADSDEGEYGYAPPGSRHSR